MNGLFFCIFQHIFWISYPRMWKSVYPLLQETIDIYESILKYVPALKNMLLFWQLL